MPVTIKQAHLKYKDPETGNYVPVSAIGSPSNPVLDVQVNNASVVQNGTANIPMASTTTLGTVKVPGYTYGIGIMPGGDLYVSTAGSPEIKQGIVGYRGVAPDHQHEAVFYGLAKAAGDSTQASSSNAVGTYTDGAKASIQNMLGVLDKGVIAPTYEELAKPIQNAGTAICERDGTLYINTVAIAANEEWTPANWRSLEFFGGVAGYAAMNQSLIVSSVMPMLQMISSVACPIQFIVPVEGTAISTSAYSVGDIFLCKAISDGLCKATSSIAIGDTIVAGTSSGCNCVVIDNIITNMPKDVQVNGTSVVSNGVANIPVASSSAIGAIKVSIDYGTNVNMSTGTLRLYAATSENIKAGNQSYRPIVSEKQHESTFYGLAKAAGDTTQSASSNNVGTYTDDAKAAIQTMLGVPGDVQVNGTSVVSNGVANVPVASDSAFGTIKVTNDTNGVTIDSNGQLKVSKATTAQVQYASDTLRPITPALQARSAFYGLAQAAGQSNFNVNTYSGSGSTYTAEAKAAIKSMLGVTDVEVVRLA